MPLRDTITLPDGAAEWPYAWNTLLGIAADRGHTSSPPYGDDRQLQARCAHCGALLWIDNNTVRDRALLDDPCTWMRSGVTL